MVGALEDTFSIGREVSNYLADMPSYSLGKRLPNYAYG